MSGCLAPLDWSQTLGTGCISSLFQGRSMTLPIVPALSRPLRGDLQAHKLHSVLMKLNWKMHYSNSRAFSLPDVTVVKPSPRTVFSWCLLLKTHSYWFPVCCQCGYNHSASYLSRFQVFSTSNKPKPKWPSWSPMFFLWGNQNTKAHFTFGFRREGVGRGEGKRKKEWGMLLSATSSLI